MQPIDAVGFDLFDTLITMGNGVLKDASVWTPAGPSTWATTPSRT